MSVYFARVGAYIKIGFSGNPMARSTTITRTGTRPDDVKFGADVDLIGWVPGDVWGERAYHVKHIDNRVAGEWFRLDRETAQKHIWDDPRGVDLRRMSALAVFASIEHPELTRDEIAASGIPVEAVVKPVGSRLIDRALRRTA